MGERKIGRETGMEERGRDSHKEGEGETRVKGKQEDMSGSRRGRRQGWESERWKERQEREKKKRERETGMGEKKIETGAGERDR